MTRVRPRLQRWHFSMVVTKEVAVDSPMSLDGVEQLMRDHAAEKNAELGLRILSDTGIEWFESPNQEPADYDDTNRRFLSERAWERGEPVEYEYLFCRLAGVSVPAEEPR